MMVETGRLYIAARRVGKTMKMVEWARETGGTIICFSEKEAQRLRDLDLGDGDAISCHRSEKLRGRNVPVAVDNAEIVLASMLGTPIEKLTLTP